MNHIQYICVWILYRCFHEYMIAGKTLLAYTNLFSSNDYQKNEYFKEIISTSKLVLQRQIWHKKT